MEDAVAPNSREAASAAADATAAAGPGRSILAAAEQPSDVRLHYWLAQGSGGAAEARGSVAGGGSSGDAGGGGAREQARLPLAAAGQQVKWSAVVQLADVSVLLNPLVDMSIQVSMPTSARRRLPSFAHKSCSHQYMLDRLWLRVDAPLPNELLLSVLAGGAAPSGLPGAAALAVSAWRGERDLFLLVLLFVSPFSFLSSASLSLFS